jgi:mannose-binding lectin 2
VPPVAYLGFSAETGELSDNHDIISVRTQNLYLKAGSSSSSTTGKKTASSAVRPKESSGGGSWSWFLFKFVLFGLAVTGAYVGFTVYRARQRDRF